MPKTTEECSISLLEEIYQSGMSLQDIFQNTGGSSLIASRTECFVHVEGSRLHTRLTFINNTAGRGGDVLYGGLVALGYDGDWNCLLSFKNIYDMSQQSGLSLINFHLECVSAMKRSLTV